MIEPKDYILKLAEESYRGNSYGKISYNSFTERCVTVAKDIYKDSPDLQSILDVVALHAVLDYGANEDILGKYLTKQELRALYVLQHTGDISKNEFHKRLVKNDIAVAAKFSILKTEIELLIKAGLWDTIFDKMTEMRDIALEDPKILDKLN